MVQHIHHHCVLVLSGKIEREPFFFWECLWEGTKNNRHWGSKLGQSQQTDREWAFAPQLPQIIDPIRGRRSVDLETGWGRAGLTGGELPHTSHRRIHPRSRRRLPQNPTSPRPLHPADNQFTSLVGPGPRYLFPPTSSTPLHGRCPLPPTSTNPTLLFNLSPSPRRAPGLWQPNHLPSRVQSCTSRGDNPQSFPFSFAVFIHAYRRAQTPTSSSLQHLTQHPLLSRRRRSGSSPTSSQPQLLLPSSALNTLSFAPSQTRQHAAHLLRRCRARWPPSSGL